MDRDSVLGAASVSVKSAHALPLALVQDPFRGREITYSSIGVLLQREVRDLVIATLRLELDVHNEALCRNPDTVLLLWWRTDAGTVVL